ncbi:TetR/AcrR family transcriptional regulator [Novispirillum itersonii]|uniref:TetR/AcrR family transcriptional regulator n=1 Tax=Novispirillum itersonii TaxID=189 RepID=UPI0003696F9D|nr:TetR/AcrR family transcriptional regulator [Novispirillum itersonii]
MVFTYPQNGRTGAQPADPALSERDDVSDIPPGPVPPRDGRRRARTPQEQERVRRQFLDCARRVHARDGVAGLTMRRLAAEAGYSPGTLYLYFSGRQDLLRELWSEDLSALLETMRTAVSAVGEAPASRLTALFSAYADFWWQRPDPFRAMFLEADHQFVQEREAFAADPVVQRVNVFILDQVRLAVPAGTGPQDLDVIAHGMLAAVHGVISLHIGNSGFPWADRAQMTGFVLKALTGALTAGALTAPPAR